MPGDFGVMTSIMDASSLTDLQRSEVEQLARMIWESEGRPEGRSMQHWLRAEEQLRKDKQAKRKRKQERAARIA
jgi:hypothetical protein